MEAHALPIDMVVAWHGRLMVLAWVFLFPAGILISRFFKVTPNQNWPHEIDNRFWWKSHLWLQCSGGVVVALALVLIMNAADDVYRQNWVHRYLGWLLIGMCTMQFLSGLLRGTMGGPTNPAPDGSCSGDHFDMTTRRRAFELFHRTNGYVMLVLSVASVTTGLATALAPSWMLPFIALWWLFVIAVFAYLQRRGMSLDSYQAIWGQGASPETRQKLVKGCSAEVLTGAKSDHTSTSGKPSC